MAHDHRMNPVGEPHLNKVNRMGKGRSELPRLRGMLTQQLLQEHGHVSNHVLMPGFDNVMGRSVIQPDLEPAIADAVDARVSNYRQDRGKGGSMERQTADELGARFSRRQYFGDGDWA
jgi:hypothetical protein